MQFVIIGQDGTDDQAEQRRQDAREAHFKECEDAIERGEHLIGAALLSDSGKMTGSVMIVEFPDRAALDKWLATEPYVTDKVWEKVDIIPCKVGPAYKPK